MVQNFYLFYFLYQCLNVADLVDFNVVGFEQPRHEMCFLLPEVDYNGEQN